MKPIDISTKDQGAVATGKMVKLVRVLSALAVVAMVATPLSCIAGYWLAGWEKLIPEEYYKRETPPSIWLMGGVLLLQLVPPLCLAFVFYWLRRMLTPLLFRKSYFDPFQSVYLCWAGGILLLRELLSPLIHTLVVLLVSSGNPPGKRTFLISLSLNTELLFGVTAGLFLILLSGVMKEAHRLYRENQAIV